MVSAFRLCFTRAINFEKNILEEKNLEKAEKYFTGNLYHLNINEDFRNLAFRRKVTILNAQ